MLSSDCITALYAPNVIGHRNKNGCETQHSHFLFVVSEFVVGQAGEIFLFSYARFTPSSEKEHTSDHE